MHSSQKQQTRSTGNNRGAEFTIWEKIYLKVVGLIVVIGFVALVYVFVFSFRHKQAETQPARTGSSHFTSPQNSRESDDESENVENLLGQK